MSELTAHGSGTQNVASDAVWEAGQWQVVLRRSLPAAEEANELDFSVGQMIPVAFFAWDGDNGEEGTRGAISSWYFLHLGEPTPATVYVAPVAAMALTALLGVGVVRRAQRRERNGGGEASEETVAAAGPPPEDEEEEGGA